MTYMSYYIDYVIYYVILHSLDENEFPASRGEGGGGAWPDPPGDSARAAR